MLNPHPYNRRANSRSKSLYQVKFLFILWAVFFSVLISFFTPPDAPDAEYIPVFSMAAVKGAAVENDPGISDQNVAFLSQEITAQKVVPSATPIPIPKTEEKKYGKSRQIGEYTWTIDVGDDERAGTADEIFQALNEYRKKNGKGTLSWNGKLAEFAKTRADKFASENKTDSHAGFKDYLNNQDGFTKLGFMRIGENSSYGYKVLGVHLIEWIYAGDAPHDNNQLSSDWTHVGVGVNGTSTNLIFAGSPL
jgi:uncharacterized protein YkwD